jgi:hypothetical protein
MNARTPTITPIAIPALAPADSPDEDFDAVTVGLDPVCEAAAADVDPDEVDDGRLAEEVID